VAIEGLLVVGEVRRADDRDRSGAAVGRVRGELDGVGRRLGACVDRDLEPAPPCFDEPLGGPLALVDGEEDPLTGRPQGEDAVEPTRPGKEIDVGPDGVFVERGAAVTERRNRRGKRAPEHGLTLESGSMAGLRVERDGPILRVTLAKPERRNAFDAELIAELHEAFRDVGDARVVLLSGEGESFCAGADIEWQRSAISLSFDENVEDAMRLFAMMQAIDGSPAPVVARIQGYALGGGAGLAAAVDVAIAAEDAVFGFSEVKLGIIPAVISPFVLPKIGEGAARRYFLTGERFDAQAALRIGLVSEVADDLDGAVDRVVGELLTSGPQAAREAKRLVRTRPQGEETAQWAARMRASDEGQEGLRAFLERRKADWPD
jgi:methylglutaconyl-CoA hydratase